MNVLLVNPYIYDFTAYDLWLRPMGLHYIAAAIRHFSDAQVFWLDLADRFQDGARPKSTKDGRGKFQREIVPKPEIYLNMPRHYSRFGLPYAEFQKKIAELPKIDIIFMTTLMTYWLEGAQITLQTLQQRFPRAKSVVGGVIPSLMPEQTARLLPADYHVRGAGETVALSIIEQSGGKVQAHPDLSDINSLPHPDFTFTGCRDYLPLLTSRGCPYSCSYCASNLLQPRFCQRRSEDVAAEIKHHEESFATRHFIIFDDAFLVNKHRHFQAIFQQVAKNSSARFHTPNGVHPREIDQESATLLYQSRFDTLRLSLEGNNPELLAKSSEKINQEQACAALRHLEMAGYKRSAVEAYLLFGYPGQSLPDMEESLAFVAELGALPRLALFSPVPGTRDCQDLQAAGRLATPLDPLETNKLYHLYCKSDFSSEEILHIKTKTMAIVEKNRQEN